jgi:pyridoxal phosphate enzyme (YggS family)
MAGTISLPVPPERLAANLQRVRGQLAAAARRAGREPERVTLVAVTKYVGPEEVRELVRLGVTELGENRIQPALSKIAALRAQLPGARWRMIGHLQTNKVRAALRDFGALDSVDSLHLLECLAREARGLGRIAVPCLAEINVGGEEQKYGLAPGDLRDFLRRAGETPECDFRGLMCMAPYAADQPAVSRPIFRKLRELRDEANANGWYRRPLVELSMGMTGDFECAIEEGATLVRIGSALYQ